MKKLCTLLAIVVMVCSKTAGGAPLEFAIDPTASYVRVVIVDEFTSGPQSPGSNVTSLFGSLAVDVTPASLQFLSTSEIRFAEQSAPQAPLADGTPGESMANFGLTLNAPGMLVGTASGRGFVGDAVSAAIEVTGTSFDATQVQFDVVSGSIAYNVMYFVDPKSGSTDALFQWPNAAAGGQIEVASGLYTITLPLMVNGLVNVEGGNLRISYEGMIVARQVPEPGCLGLASVGATLAAAGVSRRSRATCRG